MQDGDFLQGNFHAHVTPGHHDGVRYPEDLVNVLHTLHVFNLGDDVDGGAVLLRHDVADLHDVVGVAGKGSGNEVKAVFNGEKDILPVLVADEGHGQVHIGDVDALAVGDGAAVVHLAANLRVRYPLHGHAHQAVVNEDGAAGLHIPGQILVADADAGFIAHHVLGGQGEQLPGVQGNAVFPKGANADLRALGVQHGGHGQPQFLPQAAYLLVALEVVFTGVVGKVEPGHVHTRQHQGLDEPLFKQVRAHSEHDLSSA